MIRYTPSRDPEQIRCSLEGLIPPAIDSAPFRSPLLRLQKMSAAFAAFCPPPWPSPGLFVTPEIHYQSELWFPLALLQPLFARFRHSALTFFPFSASDPFSEASSWAGVAAALPPGLSRCTTPERLLLKLLTDYQARKNFLFWSSMPDRYYGGGLDRYPRQTARIRQWLHHRQKSGKEPLCCLDAACGDGAATYGLARLFLDLGFSQEQFHIEGWTIDPLEVWGAAHCTIPHAPQHQETLRRLAEPLFVRSAGSSLLFRQADLLTIVPDRQRFDLILCNGLLGGPVIQRRQECKKIIDNLAALLKPGGILLASDNFHGGWKQKYPQQEMQALFASAGLLPCEAGEGTGGLKQGEISRCTPPFAGAYAACALQ